MTATDRVTLAGFLASNNINRGAQVALSVVSPTVEGGARQASRLQAVASALNQMGVATIAQPPTVQPAADVAGAQRDDVVVVAYALAVLPTECPGYNTPVQLDQSGRPVSVWGCANAANLGMMVADPRDLVEGRTFGPGDGEKGALDIRTYRTGAVPEVQAESTSSE
jgi:pilus assembly protein CpaD